MISLSFAPALPPVPLPLSSASHPPCSTFLIKISPVSPFLIARHALLFLSGEIARYTVQVNRMRRFTRMPSSIALSITFWWFAKSKFVKNPSDPSAKGRTGGTMRWNSHEVNRTVPSPPSCRWFSGCGCGEVGAALTVTTKSKRCGLRLHISAVQ